MIHGKVAIDAQLIHGTPTGIGEYIYELLQALHEQGISFDALSQEHFDPWRFDRRVIWDQWLLPQRARNFELLHCTAGTMPFLRRGATIVTVHDVAWLRAQQHAKFYARMYFGSMMLKAYQSASCITTVSEFSRNELLSFSDFPADKIHVVYPGVSKDFVNILRRTEVPRHRVPIILAVGTVERRKNLALIIRALAHMQDTRTRLISCGPPTPYIDECKALAQHLGVAERVQFCGYIAREELLKLYAAATVAVVPSFYEGFGLAAAQALVSGVPLIVAKTSSLPEVSGPYAHIVDVDDMIGWANALDEIVANTARANETAALGCINARKRFSWTANAAATVALYRSV